MDHSVDGLMMLPSTNVLISSMVAVEEMVITLKQNRPVKSLVKVDFLFLFERN